MPVTLSTLQKMKQEKDKITKIACYDASFGALLDLVGIDIQLVGDSLGMVVQGHGSTIPVSMDDMEYHVRCVARGAKQHSMIMGDLPFGAYHLSHAQAFENAARLMQAGAHIVKLEGGAIMADTIAYISARGIPVSAHIGLTPQSVHALGGYKVQGKGDEAFNRLLNDAKLLEQAGAGCIILECIPSALGKAISETLKIPTIGIGAGPDTDGQVLILYDLLNVYPGKKAKFVKDFMSGQTTIQAAIEAFKQAVKAGTFPAPEHCY